MTRRIATLLASIAVLVTVSGIALAASLFTAHVPFTGSVRNNGSTAQTSLVQSTTDASPSDSPSASPSSDPTSSSTPTSSPSDSPVSPGSTPLDPSDPMSSGPAEPGTGPSGDPAPSPGDPAPTSDPSPTPKPPHSPDPTPTPTPSPTPPPPTHSPSPPPPPPSPSADLAVTATPTSAGADVKVSGLPAGYTATLTWKSSEAVTLNLPSSCDGTSCPITSDGTLPVEVASAPDGTTLTFTVQPVAPLTDPAQNNNSDWLDVPATASETPSPGLSASGWGQGISSPSTGLLAGA